MAGEDWPAYYRVTVDRPPWENLLFAVERFDGDDRNPPEPRLAVDLGCGAGRDVRGLLDRGWRVLAVDREPAAIETLLENTPSPDRARLETCVADLETVEIPSADLVNANVSLQHIRRERFEAALLRILEAVGVGVRFAAMIYGDRDQAAAEPEYACVSEELLRRCLEGLEIERWVEREEETTLALGDPHHLHLFEVVARRPG